MKNQRPLTEEKRFLSPRRDDADEFSQFTAERDDSLLRLNDYKESKEILEHRLLEEEFILKAVRASTKFLENKMRSSENWKRLLERTDEEPMIMYSEPRTVEAKSMGKLLKSFATRITAIEM